MQTSSAWIWPGHSRTSSPLRRASAWGWATATIPWLHSSRGAPLKSRAWPARRAPGRRRWPGWLATALLWGWGATLTAIGYLDPQRFYHHPDGVNKLVGVVSGRLGVDLGRWLVPFQPYAQAPLDERLLAALIAAVALLLALLLVGPPEHAARSTSQAALETPSTG